MRKLALFGIFCLTASAQDAPADKVSVAFTDPSRPGSLKASLVSGSIVVKGYDGKEVIVEARARASRREAARASGEGMRRIMNISTGLTVEEENNVMRVSAATHSRAVDLTIQVPFKTSLDLKTINDGNIKVEQVQGDLEVNNVNGTVTLSDISGSAVAHALNGKVLVNFTHVTPGKPMSFSSMNGAVDVTFPPDVKANVTLRSDQGSIYSDFDMEMKDSARQIVEDSRGKGGKYRVRFDKTISGTINGGGPEIQFKNFNGPIYIRKAAK